MKRFLWLWFAAIPLLGALVAIVVNPADAVINTEREVWGNSASNVAVLVWLLLFLFTLLYGLLGYSVHLKKSTIPEVVLGGIGLMLGGATGNLFHFGNVSDFQQIILGQSGVLNASIGDLLIVTGLLLVVLGTVGYALVGRNVKSSA